MLRSVPLNSSYRHGQATSVSSDPTNRRVWMHRFCHASRYDSFRGVREQWPRSSLVGGAVRQCQNPRSLCAVIERMKTPDFIEPTHAVERVEIMRVARGELACFQITAPQVCVAKCFGALPCKKMKPQPAPVSL